MDVRLLGKKNEGEGLGVAVLVDSAFAELKDKSDCLLYTSPSPRD